MPVGVAATIGKATARTNTATVSEAATVNRSKPVFPAAAQPTVATAARGLASVHTVDPVVSAPKVLRQTQKPLQISEPPAVSVSLGHVFHQVLSTSVKAGQTRVAQTLSASVSAAASLVAILVRPRTLTTTQGEAATVARAMQRPLPTGTQMTLPPVFQSVAAVPSLTANKQAARTLSLSTAASAVASAARAITHAFPLATQPSAATVAKTVPAKLIVTVVELAQLASQKLAQVRVLASTQPQQAKVARTPARELDAAAAPVSTVALTPRRSLAATLTATATRAALLAARLLPVTQPSTATRSTILSRTLQRPQPTVAHVGIAPTSARTFLLVAVQKTRARFTTDRPTIYRHARRGRVGRAVTGRARKNFGSDEP